MPRTGRTRPLRSSSDHLAHREEIALAVAEPGAPFTASLRRIVPVDVGDAVRRLHAGRIDLFELDAPRLEVGGDRFDVVDLPRHLGGLARGLARRREHDEVRRTAVVAQSAGTLLDRIEPELLGVPAAGTIEVSCRKPCRDI